MLWYPLELFYIKRPKSSMNKAKALEKIAKEIDNCKVCKVGKSGKAVPGEGNPDADIMFVGEAPGRQEAATGRPFIGRSGQLLRSLIRDSGLKEQDVFITSPVKYLPDRPARNRSAKASAGGGTPTPADIAHGRIHLLKQLEIIQPKFVVLLGNVAALGVLGNPSAGSGLGKFAVTKMHGKTMEENGIKYFFTFHPAAGLRFPPIKKLILKDFEKLKDLV